MKTNDKIIQYLDGQLSREEAAAFEKELSESRELRDEVKSIKNFNAGISGLKNIAADEDYFVQMIPRFRSKFSLRKRFSFLSGLAYSASTATAVILIMLFVTNKNVKNEAPAVHNNSLGVQQTTVNEVQQEISTLSDQFGFVNMSREEVANSDSVLNSMLIHELNLTPQSLSEMSAADNATDIQTILQGVNEQEADAIYKEILHKKILQ
jgi:hypothetical protein